VTPFEVAFVGGDTTVDGLFVLNRIVDIIFLLVCMLLCARAVSLSRPDCCVHERVQDLLQNLVLGVYDENLGIWRVTLRMIWSKYFRTWFIIDIVSIFPFDLVGLFLGAGALDQVRVLRIVRVLRLVKLIRLLKASRCAIVCVVKRVSMR
jgi:hypothetical protein